MSHKPGGRLPLGPTFSARPRLPSQPENVIALRPVPNYTACWQRLALRSKRSFHKKSLVYAYWLPATCVRWIRANDLLYVIDTQYILNVMHLYIFVVSAIDKQWIVYCYWAARQHTAVISWRQLPLTLRDVLAYWGALVALQRPATDGTSPPPFVIVVVAVADVHRLANRYELRLSAADRVGTRSRRRRHAIGGERVTSVRAAVGAVSRRANTVGRRGPPASRRPARGRVVQHRRQRSITRRRWAVRLRMTRTTLTLTLTLTLCPRMSSELLAGFRHGGAVPCTVLAVAVEPIDRHVVLEADAPRRLRRPRHRRRRAVRIQALWRTAAFMGLATAIGWFTARGPILVLHRIPNHKITFSRKFALWKKIIS